MHIFHCDRLLSCFKTKDSFKQILMKDQSTSILEPWVKYVLLGFFNTPSACVGDIDCLFDNVKHI